MKRSIALLLAWIMMFSIAVPAFAEGEAAPPPEQTVESADASAEPPQEPIQTGAEGEVMPVPAMETEPTAEPEAAADQFTLISDIPAATGQVDVSVAKALDLGGWTPSFSVSLSGGAYFATLTAAADGAIAATQAEKYINEHA